MKLKSSLLLTWLALIVFSCCPVLRAQNMVAVAAEAPQIFNELQPQAPAIPWAPTHQRARIYITAAALENKMVTQTVCSDYAEGDMVKYSDITSRFERGTDERHVTLRGFLGKYDLQWEIVGDSLSLVLDSHGRQEIAPGIALVPVMCSFYHLLKADGSHGEVFENLYFKDDSTTAHPQGYSYTLTRAPFRLAISNSNPYCSNDIIIQDYNCGYARYLAEVKFDPQNPDTYLPDEPEIHGNIAFAIYTPNAVHKYTRESDGKELEAKIRIIGFDSIVGEETERGYYIYNFCNEGWGRSAINARINPAAHTYAQANFSKGVYGIMGQPVKVEPEGPRNYLGYKEFRGGDSIRWADAAWHYGEVSPWPNSPDSLVYNVPERNGDGYHYFHHQVYRDDYASPHGDAYP